MFTKYARGMVYWANIPKYDINPNLQSGRRPVIIVSNNVANCLSNNNKCGFGIFIDITNIIFAYDV